MDHNVSTQPGENGFEQTPRGESLNYLIDLHLVGPHIFFYCLFFYCLSIYSHFLLLASLAQAAQGSFLLILAFYDFLVDWLANLWSTLSGVVRSCLLWWGNCLTKYPCGCKLKLHWKKERKKKLIEPWKKQYKSYHASLFVSIRVWSISHSL